jgi:transcriptional regulator with XRE-family HTH domain
MRAGLTQDQVASAIEYSPISLSKLETGASKPSFEVFLALAYALDVSPNYLAGDDDAITGSGDAERRLKLNQLMLSASRLSLDWLQQLIEISDRANSDNA